MRHTATTTTTSLFGTVKKEHTDEFHTYAIHKKSHIDDISSPHWPQICERALTANAKEGSEKRKKFGSNDSIYADLVICVSLIRVQYRAATKNSVGSEQQQTE